MQVIVADRTRTCPSEVRPVGPPKSWTIRSRATTPLTGGHGCPWRQLPSISRAATPAILTFGPSAHQIGPSPSQTATGVHSNRCPEGTICASALPGTTQQARATSMSLQVNANINAIRIKRRRAASPKEVNRSLLGLLAGAIPPFKPASVPIIKDCPHEVDKGDRLGRNVSA
jgi:hypothetical protein